jgi:hypothetical protein
MRRQSDYINVIHRRLPEGWTKKDVKVFLRAQADAVEECLSQRGRPWDRAVIIPGLVKVYAKLVAAKPERRAKNPATGAWMMLGAVPEHLKARAKVLARVVRAVNPPPVVSRPTAVVQRDRYHREPVI